MQMRWKGVEMERNGQLQDLFGMCKWQDASYALHAELIEFYLAVQCFLPYRLLPTEEHHHKTPFS